MSDKFDWHRFWIPPVRERAGNRFFTSLVLCGAAFIVMSLGGIYFDGFRARLCGFLAGAGLAAGAGSTLALAYGEWGDETRFALKIAARSGFLPLAPCAVLIELPYFLEGLGVWGCVGLSALTVIPFGLSLILLIVKRRKSLPPAGGKVARRSRSERGNSA